MTLNQVMALVVGLLIGFLAGIVVMTIELLRDIDWNWGDAITPMIWFPLVSALIAIVGITIFDAFTA